MHAHLVTMFGCPSGQPQATVREAARDYRKLTAVPKELAQKEAELESRGYQAGGRIAMHRGGPPRFLWTAYMVVAAAG